MALTITVYECVNCGEFEGTSEGWVKCECEINEVLAGYFTSYKGRQNFKQVKSDTYYSNEDVLIFDDVLNDLYTNIKMIAKKLNIRVREITQKTMNGGKVVTSIYVSEMGYTTQYRTSNEISFNIYLDKNYDKPNRDNIESRMRKFLGFLSKLKDKDVSLDNRQQLIDLADREDLYWEKEQVEEYDYTFYF